MLPTSEPTPVAVLFDLDGTLVDSLDDLTASLNHVFAELGFDPHTRADVESFIGDGARMLIRRALGPEREGLEDDVLERFRVYYSAHLTGQTRVYDGARALLTELSRRGIPFAVLSNKPHAMTVKVVEALLPGHPFVSVFGQREGVPKKPDPQVALEIAAMIEAASGPISSFFFVGDTPVDIKTAHAAKMRAIGVDWGMRDASLLRDAGAEVVLEHPSQLLDLLET